jgi:hypothetical protein
LFLLFLSPKSAFAQLQNVEDPLKGRFNSLGEVLSGLLPYIFTLAGMITFLFLIWGGIKYLTAQGDAKQVDSAKQTITSAIIGLVVILSVVAILEIIKLVFKINVLG